MSGVLRTPRTGVGSGSPSRKPARAHLSSSIASSDRSAAPASGVRLGAFAEPLPGAHLGQRELTLPLDQPRETEYREAEGEGVEQGPRHECQPADPVGRYEYLSTAVAAKHPGRNPLDPCSWTGAVPRVKAPRWHIACTGRPVRRPKLLCCNDQGHQREQKDKVVPPLAPDRHKREGGRREERNKADTSEPPSNAGRSVVDRGIECSCELNRKVGRESDTADHIRNARRNPRSRPTAHHNRGTRPRDADPHDGPYHPSHVQKRLGHRRRSS